jgi:hypothetical protein
MTGNKYILAAVLACAPLATHAETVYTFDNVIAIEHQPTQALITGVLLDDTQRITVTLPWESGSMYERCEKVFNVVLSQPTAYNLTVVTETLLFPGSPGQPDTLKLVFTRCRANLKP